MLERIAAVDRQHNLGKARRASFGLPDTEFLASRGARPQLRSLARPRDVRLLEVRMHANLRNPDRSAPARSAMTGFPSVACSFGEALASEAAATVKSGSKAVYRLALMSTTWPVVSR